MPRRQASLTLGAPLDSGADGAGSGQKPMRKHRRHSNSVERLRLAIDCLPLATRAAMLAGVVASERVIAGAYVDGHGGVCPMLAAHRRGARIDFLSFAKSWDRFTRAGGGPRPATARELRILVTQLEASLADAGELDFDRAIAEHRELRGRRKRGARVLREAAEPSGQIVARRLRESADAPSGRAPQRRRAAASLA